MIKPTARLANYRDQRHPFGLWEGTTENKALCTALIRNLIERGLDPEVPRLYVIDGGKGLRAAIQACSGAGPWSNAVGSTSGGTSLTTYPRESGYSSAASWTRPALRRTGARLRRNCAPWRSSLKHRTPALRPAFSKAWRRR